MIIGTMDLEQAIVNDRSIKGRNYNYLPSSKASSYGMGYFMASVVVGLAMIITVAICQVQLPCHSPLRPIPSLATFFEHCNSSCRYNEWTQVIPQTGARPVSVPDSQCQSELALLGDRLQTPINLYECTETFCEICETRREEGFVCVSTCLYSNWTELTPLNNASLVTVLQSQCLSELAILGERLQQALSSYECTGTQCVACQDRREVSFICSSTCNYSDWTEPTPLNNATPVTVLQSQCLSELAILGERWQQALSGYECTGTQCVACQDRREVSFICSSTCNYSDWTEPTPLNNATPVTVLQSQCLSELAILGERWQQALSGYECTGTQCVACQDRREVSFICSSTCNYSDWTEPTPLNNATPVTVLQSQCLSELAILGERWQQALSGYECTGTQCVACQDRREVSFICSSTCNYSDWTEPTPLNNATPVTVLQSQCLSGLAILGERWQQALSGYECTGTQCVTCQDRREVSFICSSTCNYSDWTEPTPLNNATPVTVLQSQCLSELAILGERRQQALSGYECTGTQCVACQDRREVSFICSSTCNCSDWTELTPLNNATPVTVLQSQCLSELAILGERWQQALSGYECTGTQCVACQERREVSFICSSTCNYSDWTEPTPLNNATPVMVLQSQCLSGLAILGERWQQALSGYECTGTQCVACQDRREVSFICSSTCNYSDWTEPTPLNNATPVTVLQSQCLSGLAILGERWQQALSGYECTGTQCVTCQDRREVSFICSSTCNYSDWTEPTPLNNATPVTVLQSQCLSELAILGERRQQALSGYECTGTQCVACQDRREVSFICSSTCNCSDWTELTPLNNATPVTVLQSQCLSELAILGERRQQALSGYECTGTQCVACQDRREVSFICSSTCNYSDWTEPTPLNNATTVVVPESQCLSGSALPGERWQIAIGGYECSGTQQCEECRDRREDIYICMLEFIPASIITYKLDVAIHTCSYNTPRLPSIQLQELLPPIHAGEPSIAERLIVLFQLGNRGQNHQRDQTDSGFGSGFQSRRSNGAYPFPYDMEICNATQACNTQQGE